MPRTQLRDNVVSGDETGTPIDGTITMWVPEDGEDKALFYCKHDKDSDGDSDAEDLEEWEANEAVLAWNNSCDTPRTTLPLHLNCGRLL